MSKTIVFFGNERLATGVDTTVPTLKALIKADYKVTAVVSNYEKSQSRSNRTLEIATVAKKANIPIIMPSNPIKIIDQLSGYGATVGVLVAYGKIVPQEVIDIFPRGIVNIHPSALPAHRGPTPIESVILDGSSETAVSLMQLVKKMDAGPVYAQQAVNLSGKETKQELSDKLLKKGGDLLIDTLPSIIDGSCKPKIQDDTQATYDTLITKQDGVIKWTKSAAELEREIRAFASWPKSHATIFGKDVIIIKAHVVDRAGKAGEISTEGNLLIVCCGEDALAIDNLKPSGKNEMTGSAFVAGYIQKT